MKIKTTSYLLFCLLAFQVSSCVKGVKSKYKGFDFDYVKPKNSSSDVNSRSNVPSLISRKNIKYDNLLNTLLYKNEYEDDNILFAVKNSSINVTSKSNKKTQLAFDDNFWKNTKKKQFNGDFELKYISEDFKRYSIKPITFESREIKYMVEYKEGVLFDVETQDFSTIKKNLEREIKFEEMKVLSLVSDFKTNQQLKSGLKQNYVFKKSKDEVLQTISNQKEGSTVFLFGHQENGKFVKYGVRGNVEFEISAEEVNAISKGKINLYPFGCNTASSKFEVGSTKILNSINFTKSLIEAKGLSKNYGELLSNIAKNNKELYLVVKDNCFENISVEPLKYEFSKLNKSTNISVYDDNSGLMEVEHLYNFIQNLNQSYFFDKNVYYLSYCGSNICINQLNNDLDTNQLSLSVFSDYVTIKTNTNVKNVLIANRLFLESEKVISEGFDFYCYDEESSLILPIFQKPATYYSYSEEAYNYYLYEYIDGIWLKSRGFDFSHHRKKFKRYYSSDTIKLIDVQFDTYFKNFKNYQVLNIPIDNSCNEFGKYTIDFIIKRLTLCYPDLNFIASPHYEDSNRTLRFETIEYDINYVLKKNKEFLLNYKSLNRKYGLEVVVQPKNSKYLDAQNSEKQLESELSKRFSPIFYSLIFLFPFALFFLIKFAFWILKCIFDITWISEFNKYPNFFDIVKVILSAIIVLIDIIMFMLWT